MKHSSPHWVSSFMKTLYQMFMRLPNNDKIPPGCGCCLHWWLWGTAYYNLITINSGFFERKMTCLGSQTLGPSSPSELCMLTTRRVLAFFFQRNKAWLSSGCSRLCSIVINDLPELDVKLRWEEVSSASAAKTRKFGKVSTAGSCIVCFQLPLPVSIWETVKEPWKWHGTIIDNLVKATHAHNFSVHLKVLKGSWGPHGGN